MTLKEIESLDKEMLVPAEIAEVLGSDPQTIRWQARKEPWKLGFPIIVVGNRVKIPRLAFLAFISGSLMPRPGIPA